PPFHGVCQRAIRRVLHDKVEQVALDAAIMHRQNVGMVEIAEQPGLALEPPGDIINPLIGVVVARLDDFDGDGAVADPDLLAKIDLAHAALANFANELAAAYLTSLQMQHRALQRIRRIFSFVLYHPAIRLFAASSEP